VRSLQTKDLPNIISMLRLVAVAPVVYLLALEQFGWGLLLFALAGLSDGVDGFLAKKYGWQSRLGGILDPLADKALLIGCYLVLGVMALIPLWLTLAVVLRDLIIVCGGLLYHHLVAHVRATPSFLSKINTLVQILLVVAVIANAGPLPLPGFWIETLIWICLTTTLLSGLLYVVVWGRMAVHNWPRHQA